MIFPFEATVRVYRMLRDAGLSALKSFILATALTQYFYEIQRKNIAVTESYLKYRQAMEKLGAYPDWNAPKAGVDG